MFDFVEVVKVNPLLSGEVNSRSTAVPTLSHFYLR